MREKFTEPLEVASGTGASTSVSVLFAWGWNSSFPEHAMSAEVAAAVGGLFGPLIEEIRNFRRVWMRKYLYGKQATREETNIIVPGSSQP